MPREQPAFGVWKRAGPSSSLTSPGPRGLLLGLVPLLLVSFSQPCLRHYINPKAVHPKNRVVKVVQKSAVCSRWPADIHRLCFEIASAFPHSSVT